MKILLIEDYAPLRESIAKGLRESDYAVDVSEDGEEGLWFAQTNDYDAIVLDIMLPGLDGLSIVRRLRDEGRSTPILLLTARTAVEDRVEGLNTGADDYLTKPFAFEELLSRVRALVRRCYNQPVPRIVIGDLTIDTVGRSVLRGGSKLVLTPREYTLLEYLASRSGEVVSRTEIWEHVFDFHEESTSNVVDVHISGLRKKLREGALAPLIHTRRGEGYVMEESP